jgi:hypothetical protein
VRGTAESIICDGFVDRPRPSLISRPRIRHLILFERVEIRADQTTRWKNTSPSTSLMTQIPSRMIFLIFPVCIFTPCCENRPRSCRALCQLLEAITLTADRPWAILNLELNFLTFCKVLKPSPWISL